jgi:hypothetical protein
MDEDTIVAEVPIIDEEDIHVDRDFNPTVSIDEDFARSPYKYKLDNVHNWIQRGYYIHCTACPLEHGIHVGKDQIMVGLDEKNVPILKTRNELGLA